MDGWGGDHSRAGLPSALDALLLLAGAVTGFAAVGLAPRMRGEIRVWGGLHLSVGRVEHLAAVGRDPGHARASRQAARRFHGHIGLPARHRPAVLAGHPSRPNAGAPELRRSLVSAVHIAGSGRDFAQTLGTILTRASCTALSRSASC